jgi:hypothetical protein
MARYSLTFAGITPVAVADTTNMTDAGYCTFLQGGSATQRINVNEVSISGEAPSASTVNRMVFARDSTVAATAISGNRNAALDGSTTAPGTLAVFGHTSTTKPQRSSTLHLLYPTLNTFGGIYRWQARQGEEISIVTATQPLGEASLSSISGVGIVSGHILYEVC